MGLQPPEYPVAVGVLYCDPAPTYEQQVLAGVPVDGTEVADLNGLLRTGRTWSVEG